jgi:hypothetical protein
MPRGRCLEGSMTVIPGTDSFRRYIQEHGLPMGMYLDRRTICKSTAKPTIRDKLNAKPLSEFERALKELGVEVIEWNDSMG